MESKKITKTATATTANITKGELMESVKPNEMVTDVKDIRANFGKCAILIKDNVIFRTSTQTAEKAPLSVKELYLPNYGKMRKFVVLEDGVYEITTEAEQKGTEFAQYVKADKVLIDASKIDFSLEHVWNKITKVEKVTE